MIITRVLYLFLLLPLFLTAIALDSYSQEIEYKYQGATPVVKEPEEMVVKDIDEPPEPDWGGTQIDRFEITEPSEPLEEELFKYLDGYYDNHLMAEEPPELSSDIRVVDDGCPVGVYCGGDYESLLIEPPYVPGELYIITPAEECPINIKCN